MRDSNPSPKAIPVASDSSPVAGDSSAEWEDAGRRFLYDPGERQV